VCKYLPFYSGSLLFYDPSAFERALFYFLIMPVKEMGYILWMNRKEIHATLAIFSIFETSYTVTSALLGVSIVLYIEEDKAMRNA
jgi:hypothetical protein